MKQKRNRPIGLRVGACAMGVGLCAPFALAQNSWVNYVNETSTRFQVAPALGATDPEEKDYAWGDVNNNGWIDLVIMRKQPFSTPGKRVNVLMMNEGGILVDRTALYASATDVPGDQGFLTPTNDRHSTLADLLNNGWLDLTTATAYGNSDPKSISHPRIYINLGNQNGNWQGFRYEVARMPTWSPAPNTCHVAAGDVNQSGFNDLYFVTYSQSAPDMLIVNDGNGFFSIATQSLPGAFTNSGFGTAVFIADLNQNGFNDIIKSENGPVKSVFNFGNGNFSGNVSAYAGAAYHMNIADLNNNGRLDLIISDDGSDRVRYNLSTAGNGTVNWSNTVNLPEHANGFSPSTGFNGNVYAVDLNNNGWLDIVQADVDVDAGGCGRHSNIYRNNGNPPTNTFAWDPATIPASMRQGTHDFAPFDITGNGWIDLVVGRCSGTQLWRQIPPFDLDFDYPEGRPSVIPVGTSVTLKVHLSPQGGVITAESPTMHVSVNGGAWQAQPMSNLGDNLFSGSLPAIDCLDEINYYFSAQVEQTLFTDPANAPDGGTFVTIAAEDSVVVYDEDFDSVNGGFMVDTHPSLTQGAWSYGTPTGALFLGQPAAPFGDASDSGNGKAWTTCLGGNAATCNVAFGPTHLLSPVFDLSGGPAQVVYDRWFFCNQVNDPNRKDWLKTYISNDGGETWVFVHEIDTTQPAAGVPAEWQTASFVVSDYVTPTANVVVRFTVEDPGNDSITNAGIDNIRIEDYVCDTPGTPCPADLTGSGTVGVPDLLELLGNWGPCPAPCPADLTGSGSVGVPDLLELLSAWGSCPQ